MATINERVWGVAYIVVASSNLGSSDLNLENENVSLSWTDLDSHASMVSVEK